MKIIEKNIDELIPYEKNPRFNESSVEQVANSIREFGFKVPIIIDKDNVVVAGHTRLKASKRLGLEKVPCIVADENLTIITGHTRYLASKQLGLEVVPCIIASDLSDEQVKAFRLADNKVAETSMWDYKTLREEFEAITGYIS